MAIPSAKPALPIVLDDVDAPVIYADELVGAGSLHGNISLTFSVVQHDHSQTPVKPYRKVCLRLVLPAVAVRAIVQLVGQATQGGQGISPSAPKAQ